MSISWSATPSERLLIKAIATRAIALFQSFEIRNLHVVDLEMDVEATHCNGNPLDLQRLLDAPDGDFGHDISGIRRHLNRETGQLEDCFSPRTSRRVAAVA